MTFVVAAPLLFGLTSFVVAEKPVRSVYVYTYRQVGQPADGPVRPKLIMNDEKKNKTRSDFEQQQQRTAAAMIVIIESISSKIISLLHFFCPAQIMPAKSKVYGPHARHTLN